MVTISPIRATRTAFAKRPTGFTIHKINPGDACRIARTERNWQHLDDQQARNNRRKDIVQFGFWRDLDQQHAEQGRREPRGQPYPYQPRADGPRRIASGDGGDLWFRGPSPSNCPRRTSGPEETPRNDSRSAIQLSSPASTSAHSWGRYGRDDCRSVGMARRGPKSSCRASLRGCRRRDKTVRRRGCSGSGRTHSHCSRDVSADGAH